MSLRSRVLRAGAQLVAVVGCVSFAVQSVSGAPAGATMALDRPGASGVSPEGSPIEGREYGVSGQTGAFFYNYAITVPLGRSSISTPSIALSYSSQGAPMGGIADRWSLAIPEITLDTWEGQLYRQESDRTLAPRWRSSMAGDQRLVNIGVRQYNDPQGGIRLVGRFRGEHDASFAEYLQRSDAPGRWDVLTTDGAVYRFGEAGLLGGYDPSVRSPLTSVTDANGNSVTYHWSVYEYGAQRGVVLHRVRYSSNALAGLGHHAEVEFDYAPISRCSPSTLPVGARLDYRTGTPQIYGPRKLTEIRTRVRDTPTSSFRTVRRVVLGYDQVAEACNSPDHGPYRRLVSIQEFGTDRNGLEISQPAMTFGYGVDTSMHSSLRTFDFAGDVALSRGRGNRSLDKGPGLTTMLLDLDADGIADKLTASSSCSLRWYKGTGSGFDPTIRGLPSPTIPWGDGGPDLVQNCSLAGQFTYVRTDGLYPPSEATPNHCTEDRVQQGTYNIYRWVDVTGDGAPDLVTAIDHDLLLYDPNSDPAVSNPDFCPVPTAGPIGEGPLPEDGCPFNTRISQKCGSNYVWRVYVNNGDGGFSASPIVLESPIPLNAAGGDAFWNPSKPGFENNTTKGWNALQDIDGDGIADQIKATGTEWRVWRGVGDGTFAGRADGTPYIWAAPDLTSVSLTTSNVSGFHVSSSTTAALMDVNADGLPDALTCNNMIEGHCSTSAEVTYVFLNTGTGFDPTPLIWNFTSPVISSTQGFGENRPGCTSLVCPDDFYRNYTTRAIDFDGDGRLDRVRREPMGSSTYGRAVQFSRGDSVSTSATTITLAPSEQDALFGYAEDIGRPDEQWRMYGDIVDVTGDGVPDWIENGKVSSFGPVYNPPRVLHHIDNGGGLTVDLQYMAHTDPRVAQGDGAPGPTWIVERMTSKDVSTQVADGTVRYEYDTPIYNQDDHGDWAFRGFAEVTTVNPNGSRVVNAYAYDEDWSGRLVESVTYLDETQPHTISTSDYELYKFYNGKVETFHVVSTEERTCNTEQDKTECLSNPAATTEVFLQPRTDPLNGETMLVVPNAVRKSIDYSWSGVRVENKDFAIILNEDRFLVLPLADRLWEVPPGGSFELRRQTTYDYYDSRGNELGRTVSLDSGTSATTESCYDPLTGVLLATRRPKRVAEDGPRALNCFDGQMAIRYEYDPWKVYPLITENELGHRFINDVDPGTGATMMSGGPFRSGLGWPAEMFELDGFGRVVKSYRNVDNVSPSLMYRNVQVAEAAYFDDEIPARVETRRRIDYDADSWIEAEQRYSGAGHLLYTATESASGPAATTYEYDGEGHVLVVHTPNPAADTTAGEPAAVSYEYGYDALGRITRFAPPLGGELYVAYDGLVEHRTQVELLDGSPPKPATLTRDVFGRLVQVDELTEAGTLATTSYTYDANDNMRVIVDADGIETVLDHDLGNRRRAVHREGRTWTYEYDRHGNLESVTIPFDGDPSLAVEYTTSYAYDPLDRRTSRLVGGAELSADDLLRYGQSSSATSFTYDDMSASGNGVGNLTSVSLPHSQVAYQYTAEGWPSRKEVAFSVQPFEPSVPPISDTRSIAVTYNALGQPVDQTHADGIQTRALYDERGLPRQLIGFDGSAGAWRPIATMVRGLSGVLIRRDSGGFSSKMEWDYDRLGRVTESRIGEIQCQRWYSCSFVQLAGEGLAYEDSGNVRSVANFAHGHTLSFTYDTQHQLKTASSTDLTTYAAFFDYHPGGRIKEVDIGTDNPEVVANRHVRYEYPEDVGGAVLEDGASVQRLVHLDGTIPFGGAPSPGEPPVYADFEYDARGSLVTRTVNGETRTFIYDGSGRLREARDGSSFEVYFYDHDGQRLLTARTEYDREDPRVRLTLGATEISYATSGAVSQTVSHVSLGAQTVADIRNADINAPEHTFSGVLGSLLAVLDTRGNALATFSYGPYGEILESLGSQPSEYDRLYNGKPNDALSGFAYYGFRYYDVASLTWARKDPMYQFLPDAAVDEPRRMGLYSFNLNNPLRYVDPDGREPAFTLHIVDDHGYLGEATRQKTEKLVSGSLNRVTKKSKNKRVSEGFNVVVRDKGFSNEEIKKLGRNDFVVYVVKRADESEVSRKMTAHLGKVSKSDVATVMAGIRSNGGRSAVKGGKNVGFVAVGMGPDAITKRDNAAEILTQLILHEGVGHPLLGGNAKHSKTGVFTEEVDRDEPAIDFSAKDARRLRKALEGRLR